MENGKKATAAFRRFARYGFDRRKLSPLAMTESIRGSASGLPAACEMLAVYDTLRYLRASGKSETIEAMEYVYFAEPHRPIAKNEISSRVLRFASSHHLDERTVYRRLEYAKKIFLAVFEEYI